MPSQKPSTFFPQRKRHKFFMSPQNIMINLIQNTKKTHLMSLERPKEEKEPQLEEEGEGSTMFTLPADPMKQTTPKKKKRVSFDHRVKVREHIHLYDMSQSEHDAVWFTEEEIGRIREECCRTIQKLNGLTTSKKKKARQQGTTKNEEEAILSCKCRGLEYRTRDGLKLRYEHRLTAWDVVALEQERQWIEGNFDEEKIAQAYHSCADESARVAHLLALQDQKWVQDHKDDTPSIPLMHCLPVSLKPGRRHSITHGDPSCCIITKIQRSNPKDPKSSTAAIMLRRASTGDSFNKNARAA